MIVPLLVLAALEELEPPPLPPVVTNREEVQHVEALTHSNRTSTPRGHTTRRAPSKGLGLPRSVAMQISGLNKAALPGPHPVAPLFSLLRRAKQQFDGWRAVREFVAMRERA